MQLQVALASPGQTLPVVTQFMRRKWGTRGCQCAEKGLLDLARDYLLTVVPYASDASGLQDVVEVASLLRHTGPALLKWNDLQDAATAQMVRGGTRCRGAL